MGIPPGKQSTSNYNPVTHIGTPTSAPEAKRTGNRFASATAAKSNLHGSACMPKEGEAGSEPTAGTHPNTLLQLPARVSHLSGTGCIPQSSRALHGGNSSSCSSDGGGSSSMSDHSKHTATKTLPLQAKMLTLRAAVDHLSGEACTVRQVDVVATLDAPPPQVVRGMATRLVLDRQVARAAHEHNMSSCLYQPGQGYTKVILTGQDRAQQRND